MRKAFGGIIALILTTSCSKGTPAAIPVPVPPDQMALEVPATLDPNEVPIESTGDAMLVAAVPLETTTLAPTTTLPFRNCPKHPQDGDPTVLPRYTRATITMAALNTSVVIDADSVTNNKMMKIQSPDGNGDVFYVGGIVYMKMEGLPWVKNPQNMQMPEGYVNFGQVDLTEYRLLEKAEYEGEIVCHYRFRSKRKEIVKGRPGRATIDAYFDDRWFQPYIGLEMKLDSGLAVNATVVTQVLEPFDVPSPS
jgi:hypothetical protein